MRRKAVESSNVQSVGYDKKRKILEVAFKHKSDEPLPIYRYTDVPPEIAQGLLEAESVGSYLHKHVKSVYKHERIK